MEHHHDPNSAKEPTNEADLAWIEEQKNSKIVDLFIQAAGGNPQAFTDNQRRAFACYINIVCTEGAAAAFEIVAENPSEPNSVWSRNPIQLAAKIADFQAYAQHYLAKHLDEQFAGGTDAN